MREGVRGDANRFVIATLTRDRDAPSGAPGTPCQP
jgi:hypothetical protein